MPSIGLNMNTFAVVASNADLADAASIGSA